MKILAAFACSLFLSTAAFACDKSAARKVQGMIQELAKVSQERGIQTVRWGNDFNSWTRDQKLKMARTTADADACLSGSAREIRFLSPAGVLNAIASPSSGIRLVD